MNRMLFLTLDSHNTTKKIGPAKLSIVTTGGDFINIFEEEMKRQTKISASIEHQYHHLKI